jgi:hypothetical protein
MQGSS